MVNSALENVGWIRMKIYIESTIPSYVVARPARDLYQAARQQMTRDWWELRRHQHELFTSQLVLEEIAAGDSEMARLRLNEMAGVKILNPTDEGTLLAQQILNSGLLPTDADFDASHISIATIHGMDVLLTWNCRHIANAAIQVRLRRLAAESGFTLPLLCTPDEIIGETYE